MHYSVSIKYNNLFLFLYFSPGHLSLVTGLLPVLTRPGPVPHVAGGVAVEPAGQDGGQAGVASPGPGSLLTSNTTHTNYAHRITTGGCTHLFLVFTLPLSRTSMLGKWMLSQEYAK